MGGWASYLKDLEATGLITSGCISKIDSKKHAKSSSFEFHQSEIDKLSTLMTRGETNVPAHVQGGEYHIRENDEVIAVGTLMGTEYRKQIVVVGKTEKFIVVCIAEEGVNDGKCRKEVQWIVDHITGEGY